MVDNKFTWVTFFKEVQEKIHNNYTSKQLANIANKIFGRIKDIDDYGNEVPIQEMTPINFIGYFNRRLSLNNRIQYCQKLKEIMNLTSETPVDFDGIPEFNNQNCLCMPFKKDRATYIVQEQWEISKQILNDNINTELFDKILSNAHPYIRLSYLSRFCFIVKPEKYYPYDKQMAINLKAKFPETYKGYNDYCKLLKYKYPEKTSYELSYEAFMENNNKQYKKQTNQKKYWLYSAGEKSYKWDEFYKDGIMAIGWDYLGDLTKYSSQAEIADKITKKENKTQYPMNDSKANWEFAKDMQVGDIVYVKKGLQDALIGRGIVKSDYIYDANRNEYKSIRKVEWTHNGIYDVDFKVLDIKQWNQKTLTEISQSKYKDFCLKIEDVFMKKQPEENSNSLQVNIPLNQILYGPPGTGKTYNTIIEAMKILTFEGLFSDWYLKVYCVTKNVDSKEKTLNDYIKHLNKINTEFLKNDNIFRYYKSEEFTKIKKYILDSNYITDDFTKNNNNSYYKHGLRRYEEFLNWLTYDKIREKYKEYKSLGQIEFVTFHQSYSYEEFVEGIKPYLDSESWDEPVEKLTYQGTNGLFKTISNLALFERLNITNQEQEAVTDFKHVKNLFIEEYEIGSTFKTKTKETEFRIDKYTDKSARITPIDGKYTYSITFKYLEEAFSKNMKTQDEIAKINGVASGLSCYYYSIYEKLLEIKKSNNKNLNQNKKLTNNEKLQLVKDYYDGKITLKNNDKSKPYVLIIDEINRGNISKIFGELITLIEEDKRENLTVTLPYSKELFTVPKNLYILGTMNTSDRSIASIDIALRRRFKFKELMPKSNMVSDFKCKFKDCFELLNKRISVLLDRDHQIGHSYFINDKHQNDGINELKNIWFDSILPLLNEYFYGDWEKLQALLGQAKNDNTSFIKKIEKISFANSYSCDESENYDFTSESECNFEFAMKNAFGNNFEV